MSGVWGRESRAISIAKNCRLVDLGKEEVRVFQYVDRQTGLQILPLETTEGDDSFESEDSETAKGGLSQPLVASGRPKRVVGAMDSENFQRLVVDLGLEEEGKEVDLSNPWLREIASNCRVFARMNPDQKALIVKIMKTYYRQFECTVGFCGDGANDCIALKEADIGISLSKTEASLSAPFISSIEDISCVQLVSCEGKCALTTNFDSFRFFCLYSMIQSIGLIVLFVKRSEYSDPVYITADIVVALNLANCIGLLKPIKHLTNRLDSVLDLEIFRLPQYTLFYKENMISIVVNSVVALAIVLFGMWVIQQDPNYVSPEEIRKDSIDDMTIPTYETTFAGLYAIQVTFGVAMTFNIKGFFKQRFFHQAYMLISVAIYQLFVFFMLFGGALADSDHFISRCYSKLIEYFAFVEFSEEVRLYIGLLVFGSTVLSIIMESLLIWLCAGPATPRGKITK